MNPSTHSQPVSPGADAFLAGGGEAGALIRAYDWSVAPIGLPEGWPAALQTLVALMLGSNQAMFVAWGPTRTLLYNDCYAEILAAKHPAALGHDFLDVWHEIRSDLLPIVEQAYRGEPVQMDDIALTMSRRGFSEETHFAFSYSPVRNMQGKILGFFCACAEITAQVLAKRRQAFLLDLAERLERSSLREALAGVAALLGERLRISRVDYGELDAAGQVVSVAHEHTDVGVQTALGTYRLDAFGPVISAELRAGRTVVVADVMDDPLTQAAGAVRGAIGMGSIVMAPLLRDGRLRATLYFYRCDPRVWVAEEVALVEEVAARTWALLERMQAEEALRDSEARLRLATDAAEIGFWDVDAVNDVLVWPARVKAMFGISPSAPASIADFYAGLHPQDREAVAAAYAAASDPDRRAVYDVDYRTVGKEDGIVRWVAAKGRGVFDGAGQCVRVIGTAIDVTARKQAEAALAASEAALRHMNETLEARVREEVAAREAAQARLAHAQRMEALGQLAGGIAHDFNNVVQAVQGGARLIEGRPDDHARVVRLAHMIAEAAGRGAAITRRLLAFSRGADLRAELIDVAALLAAMQEVLAHTLGAGVTVEVAATPGLPALLADKGQLETVLVNLAVNARDAMAGQGMIGLAAALETVEADALGGRGNGQVALGPGKYMRFSVVDTGAGMPPEVLARASEPFFTTKPKGIGTGLGLAMARGFAEQSGGALDIASAPGLGTTVLFWLPMAEGMVAASSLVVDMAAGRDRGACVLLVDDEAMVLEMVAEGLRAEGYVVVATADAAEALELLDGDKVIDLLVSDLSMPSVNGLMLIHEAQRRRPGLPAILLTGFATGAAELAMSGAISGAFSLLRKPIEAKALAERVAVLLEGADITLEAQ